MKNQWKKPELEVLDINMTMAGVGIAKPDFVTVTDPEKGQVVVTMDIS